MIVDITDPRSTLYFNQYLYSMHFYFLDAYVLRYAPEKIPAVLTTRYVFKNSRFYPNDINHAPLLQELGKFFRSRSDVKRMVFSDWVYAYTNDYHLAHELEENFPIDKIYVHQAHLVKPANVVQIKNPRWAYRSYFRERWLGAERGQTLSRFLINRTDCFGYSNSLASRMSQQGNLNRTMSHYFIEHNDTSDLKMLDFVCPGIIRKTLPIQAK